MKDDYLSYHRSAKVNEFRTKPETKVIFAVSGGSKAGETKSVSIFQPATGCLSGDLATPPGEMAGAGNFPSPVPTGFPASSGLTYTSFNRRRYIIQLTWNIIRLTRKYHSTDTNSSSDAA